jgi:predicted secreted Zn-dependent protease
VTISSLAWPSDTSVRWYDVAGASESAVRVSLSERGPLDHTGARHDAFTEWYLSWHLTFLVSEPGCATGPVSTSMHVRVTLPRWQPPSMAAPELVARWRTYLDALAWHELGHRERGLEAAAAIEAELPLLEPRASCEETEQLANQAAHQIIERFRQADRDYDEVTQHGATQGAVFP